MIHWNDHTKVLDIACSFCDRHAYFPSDTRAGAYADAEDVGWGFRYDDEICPDCTEDEDAE